MTLKFVWADGHLSLAAGASNVHHKNLLEGMVNDGLIQGMPSNYVGGMFTADNFHGPAFDKVRILYEAGQTPTPDELKFMIQQELQSTNRESTYQRLAAGTTEDTEPTGENVGFLRNPHKDLYPNLFRGEKKIPAEVKEILKNHVLDPLSQKFKTPDNFIYFTIYGSGISYNWDEGGDLDLQLWVDIEKYSATTDDPSTIDDLLADVRRIVQTVNFPTFAELGLLAPENSKEDTTGAMMIQYYPKPGKGSKDENLASKPYACYDLETDEWLVEPKPMKPEFYGDEFLLLMPKAKDIALQAEALLGEYQRNVLNWHFWFALFNEHQKEEYRKEYRESMEDATQEKQGIKTLFDGVFGGRAQAYSPEGQGIYDERDIIQKLLEVWGVFQDLKHFARAPLPWEEQEMPAPVSSTMRIASVSNEILFAGGGTFDPKNLLPINVHDGYFVSTLRHEYVVPVNEFNDAAIRNYLNHVEFRNNEYIGAWVNEGNVYLGRTLWVPNAAEAIQKAQENKQQAIWDIANKRDILLSRISALYGLPPKAIGSNPELQQVAQSYMQHSGLPYNPPQTYQRVDPQRAKRIAEIYDQLQHNPNDPRVRESYQAMINETKAQYDHLKNNGYQFEFYPPGQDPYPAGPRQAIEDLRNNKHMYVYPTHGGFGSSDSNIADHPLLQDSGERWNGLPVTHNDIFRAVHDAFGHGKEGVGFRADGEENAWRQHAAMYSPVARPAMTAETRGQNSWVNFGPYGEHNQTADQANTVYADQKAVVMPDWVHTEGANDPSIYESRFVKVAVWSDIMEKAQRLRDNGQVQINLNTPNHVVGIVQGDHGTYNTEIWRDDPNSGTITLWNCDCPWSQYSWGRTRQWKKYEGRPCAHTLALYWSSLASPVQNENQQTIPGMPTQQPATPGVNLPNALQQTIQAPPKPPVSIPQPAQQAEQMTIGFPGALSKWRKESMFMNGDYIRANTPVDGYDDRGTYYVVPRNMIGEVLWSDEEETIAIFSIESGQLGPHLVRVTAPTESFSLVPRNRGTMPRRKR